jgi:hypothetical protein
MRRIRIPLQLVNDRAKPFSLSFEHGRMLSPQEKRRSFCVEIMLELIQASARDDRRQVVKVISLKLTFFDSTVSRVATDS